jgi:hypothetical protein
MFVGGATASSINKHFKTNMIYIVSQVKENKFNTSLLIVFATLPFWFLAQHDLLIGALGSSTKKTSSICIKKAKD